MEIIGLDDFLKLRNNLLPIALNRWYRKMNEASMIAVNALHIFREVNREPGVQHVVLSACKFKIGITYLN